MSKSVRCTIIGCNSNAFKDQNVKFFKFPSRDNPLYNVWLNICYGSAVAIKRHPMPYICSKHFHGGEVGFRWLSYNAVPALKLNNPPSCTMKKKPETDLTIEQMEKARLIKLLNNTVLEWAKRNTRQSPMSMSNSDLIEVATKVRKLLGPNLTLTLDNYWCKKFRAHLSRAEPYDRTAMGGTILNLKCIIKELDPNVKIYTEAETDISEDKVEVMKLHLNCGLTTKPTPADDVPAVEAPKFTGKMYFKKARSFSNRKVDIGDKITPTKDLRHVNHSKTGCCQTITNPIGDMECEKLKKIYNNHEYEGSELIEDLNEGRDSIYPLLEVKGEVMNIDSVPQHSCCRIEAPTCTLEERAQTDLRNQQLEKTRLIKLLNNTVLEWAKRNTRQSPMSISNSDLIEVATKVRKLLGPNLTLTLDNYWCKRFRAHLSRAEPYDRTAMGGTILNLKCIIKELDPNVKIYAEAETDISEDKVEVMKLHSNCGLTTKPTVADDEPVVEAPKFTGKMYVKKAKSFCNSKVGIGYKIIPAKDLRHVNHSKTGYCQTIASPIGDMECEKLEKICNNHEYEGSSKLIEDLDEGCDSVYPLSEVKGEVMDIDSVPHPSCSRIELVKVEDSASKEGCVDIGFISEFGKYLYDRIHMNKFEGSDGNISLMSELDKDWNDGSQMSKVQVNESGKENDDDISGSNEFEDYFNNGRQMSVLKKEVASDDETITHSNCRVRRASDRDNYNLYFLDCGKVDGMQVNNPLHGLKMEVLSDDEGTFPPDCNDSRASRKFNNDLLESEKILQLSCNLDKNLGDINTNKFVESENIIELGYCIDKISKEVNADISLGNDIAPGVSTINTITHEVNKEKPLESNIIVRPDLNANKLSVLQDKGFGCKVNDFVNKVIISKPFTKQSYIDNYLKYIHNYNKPKPKHVIPWIQKHTITFNNGREQSIQSSVANKLTKEVKTKLCNLKCVSVPELQFDSCNYGQIEIHSSKIRPNNDSLEQIQPGKNNPERLKGSVESSSNDSRMNAELEEGDMGQLEIKLNNVNPHSDCLLEEESDKSDMGRFNINSNEANPSKDILIQVDSSDEDSTQVSTIFDSYWSSDDSTSVDRPRLRITSYKGALEYLKPLEDFVLRKEDYRAIGLVSSIEIHFKKRALLRHEKL